MLLVLFVFDDFICADEKFKVEQLRAVFVTVTDQVLDLSYFIQHLNNLAKFRPVHRNRPVRLGNICGVFTWWHLLVPNQIKVILFVVILSLRGFTINCTLKACIGKIDELLQLLLLDIFFSFLILHESVTVFDDLNPLLGRLIFIWRIESLVVRKNIFLHFMAYLFWKISGCHCLSTLIIRDVVHLFI